MGSKNLRDGKYSWRLKGKYPGEGPKRNTLAEAEEDGVEVKKVISPGKDEDAIRRDAQAVLRQLATAAAPGEQDLALGYGER